jgi:thioredoxin reductase (NADPH)
MPNAKLTFYGTHWCPDCRRSRQFLGEQQIPYTWIDLEENPEAEQLIIRMNRGKRIIPTIVFGDGSFLAEPSNTELAVKLGLKTTASRRHYQVIIVGGGPAGLTAALYTAREGIDTLLMESASFGGQIAATEQLDNFPGFPEGIIGLELAGRLRQQALRFGVEMLETQEAVALQRGDISLTIRTGDDLTYTAEAVLLAMGGNYKRLNIPGEDEYLGAGVHFCSTCDGPFYKGKTVAVVGGGNSAAQESLFLTQFADRVTVVVRGEAFKASKILEEKVRNHPKIAVRWHTKVREFVGRKSRLEKLTLIDTASGLEEELAVDGAFIFIGLTPHTAFLRDSAIRLDPGGFVITGHDLLHGGDRPPGYEGRDPLLLETSLPGVFAAGDVRRGSTKQAASAAGEGASAALEIREQIKMR